MIGHVSWLMSRVMLHHVMSLIELPIVSMMSCQANRWNIGETRHTSILHTPTAPQNTCTSASFIFIPCPSIPHVLTTIEIVHSALILCFSYVAMLRWCDEVDHVSSEFGACHVNSQTSTQTSTHQQNNNQRIYTTTHTYQTAIHVVGTTNGGRPSLSSYLMDFFFFFLFLFCHE